MKLSRRKGTNDFGKTYEQYVAALLGVRCALKDDIEDMWIATNVDDLGAFDDLVLFLKRRCGNDTKKDIYLFQIKYKKNRRLNLSSEENGLRKYEQSYLKIKADFLNGDSPLTAICGFEDLKFLLFANTQIDLPRGTVSYELDNVDSLTNTGKVFQSSNVTENLYDSSFLKQTYFYYNQIDVSKIETAIKREIDSYEYFMNCDVKQILELFEKWHSEAYESKVELTIEDIRSIFLEVILVRHVSVPKMAPFPKAHIWNEATSQFRYLFLEEDHLPETWQAVQLLISNILEDQAINLSNWNEPLENPSDKINRARQHFLHQNYPIPKDKKSYTLKNLYLLLCHVCGLPLVVNINASTKEFENICLALTKLDTSVSRRRYIIVGQVRTDFLQNSIPFNMNRHTQEKLQKNISLHLQGKEAVTLEELNLTRAVWQSVTPDTFIELLKTNTEKVLDIDTYIPRYLQQPVVTSNVFTIQNAVFVVITNGNIHNMVMKLCKFRPTWPWHVYKVYLKDLEIIDIIVIKETIHSYDLKDYNEIENVVKARKHKEDQNIHFLRVLEDYKFEWLYSNRNAETIKPFLISDPTKYVPDTDLFGYLTFNTLSANAGEGKSTLLQFVADHSPPDIWVVQIKMRDVTEYIETGEFSEIKKVLYDQSKETLVRYKEFSWELFQCLYDKRKMMVIIDGVDEIEWSTKIEHFLCAVKSLEVKTIIATRPSLNYILEKTFNTLSLYLKPFTTNDCEELVKCSLKDAKNDIPNSQIESAIKRISLWDNMVGVPLLLRLFVSLLKDGCLLNVDQFDITDLFDAFINEQLRKVGSLHRATIRTLSRLALFLFYNEDYLSELFSIEDQVEDLEEKMEIYVKSKLVQKTNNESFMFAHKSLAEFLVAKYFTTNLIEKRNCAAISSFLKSLFYKELETVRLFFDMIMLKGSPLQSIITSTNQTDSLNDLTDKLGRNALHIASSYGSKCDLKHKILLWPGVRIYESYNIINVDQNVLQPSQKSERRTVVPLELFRKILKLGFDPLQKDDLFKMDAFDFAVQSGSLGMIDILYSENHFKNIDNVNQNILLYSAVRHCYVNIFRRLPNKNFKLKILPVLENLLHIALRNECFELIYEITNRMVNIDEPNMISYTPLISWLSSSKITDSNLYLVKFGMGVSRFNENHLKILQHLIRKGANVNIVNVAGETPLHVLCRSQDKLVVEALEALIKHGAEVNKKTYSGDIPLHYAAQHSIDNVKVLVKHTSEIDTPNNLSYTPLCFAAQRNQLHIVKYLISKGAMINRSNNGISPLCAAVIGGHMQCIEHLINKRAKINNTKINNTLNYAIRFSDLNCVKFLIQNGAKVQKALLGLAIMVSRKDVIKYFLSEKMVDICDDKEQYAELCNAIQMADTDLVEILIDYGVNVNVKDTERGYSPLHIASIFGMAHIAELLIDRGAIVNFPDNYGYTPLMVAADQGNSVCLKTLIDKGAIVNAEALDRHSALTRASLNGHLECIKCLVDADCDLRRYGFKALYDAATKGHSDVVDYFCQFMV